MNLEHPLIALVGLFGGFLLVVWLVGLLPQGETKNYAPNGPEYGIYTETIRLQERR